jgi:cardiolipin synthase C
LNPPGRQRPLRAIGGLLLLAFAAACTPLPSLEGRTPSRAFGDTADTRLGRSVAPLVGEHPDTSGLVPLASGRDAFAARVLLADAAERSLDVQYYIWQHDMTGTLLLEALHRAADRGVRVRLLLDDNNTAGLDGVLAALDDHQNIAVRLFNPFMIRSFRPLAYLLDFSRLNRRMHNKSFTADNQATIIGGRNVGDEYFGAADADLFADLDVLAVGPVVKDVSRDFDRYWASGSSYPANRILPKPDPANVAALAENARRLAGDANARQYLEAVAAQPFVNDLLAGRLAFEWTPTRMVSDDPAKGLGLAKDHAMLPHRLGELLGEPQQRLHLISAYFVPADVGTRALTALAERGVEVEVLTNALQATDVLPVHAGYAKRRRDLLQAGVVLFELKQTADASSAPQAGFPGSSASSLHAKTFAVDGERVFIGSYNFDPRSARLNTEMGFLIDSSVLAERIAGVFDRNVPSRAYQVRLDKSGNPEWLERQGDDVLVHAVEPGTSLWERVMVRCIATLPVEWLL